jgi:hypothetical protein
LRIGIQSTIPNSRIGMKIRIKATFGIVLMIATASPSGPVPAVHSDRIMSPEAENFHAPFGKIRSGAAFVCAGDIFRAPGGCYKKFTID